MKFEARRIMDFIMGGCAGFCFFHGEFIGNAIGVLMIVSFLIYDYKNIILKSIDKTVKGDKTYVAGK